MKQPVFHGKVRPFSFFVAQLGSAGWVSIHSPKIHVELKHWGLYRCGVSFCEGKKSFQVPCEFAGVWVSFTCFVLKAPPPKFWGNFSSRLDEWRAYLFVQWVGQKRPRLDFGIGLVWAEGTYRYSREN